MTEAEAVALCCEEMGEKEAKQKVQAGVEDHKPPWTVDTKGDGLSRWRDCLRHMPLNRSAEAALEILQEMGFRTAEWEIYIREQKARYEVDANTAL